MQQASSLRKHSSNAIIDVVLEAGKGVTIVFAEACDAKTSHRYLKYQASHNYVAVTADPQWYTKSNLITESRKRSAARNRGKRVGPPTAGKRRPPPSPASANQSLMQAALGMFTTST